MNSTRIRKKLILFNICLAVFLFSVAGSLAAYTSLTSVKRVVTTQGSEQLFSSNILAELPDNQELQNRALSFSADVDENLLRITVCNYAQGNKTKWASNDINYTVSFGLVDANGDVIKNDSELHNAVLSAYRVNGTGLADSNSISDTLSSDRANENVYTVTIPTRYMMDYKIKVIATPTQPSPYRGLGRRLSVSEYTATAAWKLTFLSSEQAEEANRLGCINTKLSGQEHKYLVLKWDMKHVDIDPWFLADMDLSHPAPAAEDSEEAGWCTLVFEVGGMVDGEKRPGQYNITFYRTYGVSEKDFPGENWEDLKSYIRYSTMPITD